MNILQALRDYDLRMRRAEEQSTAENAPALMPRMYTIQEVHVELRLDLGGRLVGVVPLEDPARKNAGVRLAAPNVKRSANVRPRLLMDNSEYALGISNVPGDPKIPGRHQAFSLLVDRCAAATGEPAVLAVQHFLAQLDPAAFAAQQFPDLASAARTPNVIFSVDGVRPTDLPSVQDFWANEFASAGPDTGERLDAAACMLTGDQSAIMLREPLPIKGLAGGQTSGNNLISANAESFESYGLKASAGASVSVPAAEAYLNGLNRLLASKDTSMRLGDLTFAFWTDQGAPPLILDLLQDPQALIDSAREQAEATPGTDPAAAIRDALWGLYRARQPSLPPDARLYTLVLSANGSRTVVRSYGATTARDTLGHLARYYDSQELAGDKRLVYSLFGLITSLYRDYKKENVISDLQALGNYALFGTPLPQSLLHRVLHRIKSDSKHVTRARAVLIKMVLLSQQDATRADQRLQALDPAHPEPAYHLGRLLASLEHLQSVAVPSTVSTLSDRHYSAMSTRPHLIIDRLMAGSRQHLRKIGRNNFGRSVYLENQILQVMQALPTALTEPLSPQQQGLFALGFYHQRLNLYTKKSPPSEVPPGTEADQGTFALADTHERLDRRTTTGASADPTPDATSASAQMVPENGGTP